MSFGAWIKAKMSLDSSGVKVGVDSAKKEVGGFKDSLSKMAGTMGVAFGAGAAVAGIKNFTKEAIEMAARIKDSADQAGLSVDQYQAFYASAMQMTGGAKAAEVGLIQFRAAQQDALDGNKAAEDAFKRLGVSIEDIANKSTPQLLEAVAKGYKSTGDFSALVDVFGKKNAPKLEEALRELADDGFVAMTNKAQEAGLILGGEVVDQLDAVGDAMDRLKMRADTLWDRFLVKAGKWYLKLTEINGAVLALMFDQQGHSFQEFVDAAGAASKTFDDNFKADLDRREAARKKNEERDKATKLEKLESLKNKQIDSALDDFFREVDEADVKARSSQAAEKAKEAAKVIEAGLAKANAEADKLAVKASSGTTVREIGAPEASAARARYDSLREIGANILGSGRIGGTPADRNAEIARATRQTAENTAIIAEKLNSPPVTRMAQSVAVY